MRPVAYTADDLNLTRGRVGLGVMMFFVACVLSVPSLLVLASNVPPRLYMGVAYLPSLVRSTEDAVPYVRATGSLGAASGSWGSASQS
jgi:hypothetical protein